LTDVTLRLKPSMATAKPERGRDNTRTDMPANASDFAADPTPTNTANGTPAAGGEAERSFNEAAERFQKAVQEGIETLRAQTRTYADTAGQQLDEAQRYVSEQVKERPLVSTAAALGIGMLVGLILAGGRHR
jgi:ElaB/YqjD/DUF883 family membrane-anchored ribosome-binding protein